jgi:phosphate transport system substrate-binding protein
MKLRWCLAVAALAFSCGKKSGDEGGGAKMSDPGSKATETGPVTLNASGSTFQKAFEEVAIDAFGKTHPNIKINYGGGGSGKGRQDLSDLVVDFAGSDSPFKDADKSKIKGGDVLYFPILLGGVTVSYHLEDVKGLQLSPDTVAKIFQREVKKWNDPAIAADNPGVKLPATDIAVVRRADGSGTTDIFSKFLDGSANGAWKLKSGSTVEWPADTQAGQGNAGVAQLVKSTNGAVGYVDLSDAKAAGLSFAAIKNGGGKYIAPDAASVSAAGEGIDVKDDLTFSAVNAKGDAAYPITGQTWVIVYAKPKDKAKGAAVKDYLQFLLTDGQKLAADVDFAPLPKALADKAVAQLGKIQL